MILQMLLPSKLLRVLRGLCGKRSGREGRNNFAGVFTAEYAEQCTGK